MSKSFNEHYCGRQFFFVGKAAKSKEELEKVPPLDPRSYILQPGSRPLKKENEPSSAVRKAVEKAVEQMGGFGDG